MSGFAELLPYLKSNYQGGKVNLQGSYVDLFAHDDTDMAATGYVGIGDAHHYTRTNQRMMFRDELEKLVFPNWEVRNEVEQANMVITDATRSLRLKPWSAVIPFQSFNPDKGGPIIVMMSDPEDWLKLWVTLG